MVTHDLELYYGPEVPKLFQITSPLISQSFLFMAPLYQINSIRDLFNKYLSLRNNVVAFHLKEF